MARRGSDASRYQVSCVLVCMWSDILTDRGLVVEPLGETESQEVLERIE